MTPEAKRALVVDDDEQVRQLLGRILLGKGFACTMAADAAEARAQLQGAHFDLLISDISMPGESGLDLVQAVSDQHPEVASIIVSGLDDVAVAEEALARGAYGFVLKPFNANDVIATSLAALRRQQREHEAAHHRSRLERVVSSRIGELGRTRAALRRVTQELRASREETIERLCIAIEARDPETASHIADMRDHCTRIAGRLGMGPERCELIRLASPLHDVGKVAVPDSILLKPGALDPGERHEMERHAELGYRILAGSAAPLLQLAATIAWTHHEKFDGTGYPRRLAGENIPIEGRIAAVADVYDALTRDRVYRPALPVEEARAILEDGRGTHFDPDVLEAFWANGSQG